MKKANITSVISTPPVAQTMPETTGQPATPVVAPPIESPPAVPASEPSPVETPAAPAAPVETPLQQASEATPANVEQLVNPPRPLPPKGKGNRSFADYASLDWTKSNGELAKIAGVSRQRIQQLRQQMKDGYSPKPPPQPGDSISEVAEVPTVAAVATDYKLLAETTFDMGAGLLVMTVGAEWQPRILEMEGPNGKVKVNERDVVCNALQKYYEAKQVPDLPPGVMLAFVLCSYAAPRFKEPNTSNKCKLTYQWLKVKLGTIFKRKKNKPATATIETKTESVTHEN